MYIVESQRRSPQQSQSLVQNPPESAHVLLGAGGLLDVDLHVDVAGSQRSTPQQSQSFAHEPPSLAHEAVVGDASLAVAHAESVHTRAPQHSRVLVHAVPLSRHELGGGCQVGWAHAPRVHTMTSQQSKSLVHAPLSAAHDGAIGGAAASGPPAGRPASCPPEGPALGCAWVHRCLPTSHEMFARTPTPQQSDKASHWPPISAHVAPHTPVLSQ